MLEASIERDFRKYCIEQDVLCLKMIAAGDNGYPDRMVIGLGFIFFIEFKKPKCYPSPLQRYIHIKLRSLGHNVFCFNEPNHAENVLYTYLHYNAAPIYFCTENGITELE